MKISREHLRAEAQATGFRDDALEKVLHLISLLNTFSRHPQLGGQLALKGGTALNLFYFSIPRLSVDIDLNYVGSADREQMLMDKIQIEKLIVAMCKEEGFAVDRVPTEHAGGKFRLRYQGAINPGGNLEVDLNFLLRVPLWPVVKTDSRVIGSHQAKQTLLLDLHETSAGKLAALLGRHASRDLFDAHQLFAMQKLEREKLRLGFVVYGAMNRKDWRTVSVNDVAYQPKEVESELLPLLKFESVPRGKALIDWTEKLTAETRQGLSMVLPLEPNEREFLDRLMEHGEIVPELIAQDAAMVKRIASHPGLLWKQLNVRSHKQI
jgi:predicted nucleotidyltransferase component of viral defense system